MRWLRRTFLPASLLILGAAGMVVPLPADILHPGRIVPLATCVSVDDEGATGVEGDFLLMTVNVFPASAFDAVIAAIDPETTIERQVVPAGVDPGVYYRQQREVFQLSRNLAVAVGLQAAGLPAEVAEEGARVLEVVDGTPAARALQPDDVITEIDGRIVPSTETLRELLGQGQPGEPRTVQVLRGDETLTVDLVPVERDGVPVLGVVAETVIDVEFPFSVEVASGTIGGPSAGLMIALTVYDKVLPGVDVAAGRIIAGTGTLNRDGNVGPVGGAGLKVIAADRAGADVFLVPEANGAEARAALPGGSDLEIVDVATFEQAREWLEGTAEAGRSGGPLTDTCPHKGA